MSTEKPAATPTAAPEDNKWLVTLDPPFTFEGQTHTEVDLSGVDRLTGMDLIKASDILQKTGHTPLIVEMDTEYLLICAHLATGLPLEFFKQLPARAAIKVKNAVRNGFFGE